ncbi:MAG: redoxin family protein [Ilumatobacter sp.]
MQARRITAAVSLGLVGAVVIGLIATAGDDEQPITAAEPVPASADSESAASDEVTSAIPKPAASEPRDTLATAPEQAADPAVAPNTPDLPNRGPHPEFLPVQEWIQTEATSFDDFDGKVVAVQFWTFGCHNCQATWPRMRELYEKYAGDDFEIVGVHAPEFDFERDVDAVARAAADNGLVWPIAIDNDKLNFRSWQERRFWPRVILIDADGNVRYDHIGEGAYDEIDAAVGALITEANA